MGIASCGGRSGVERRREGGRKMSMRCGGSRRRRKKKVGEVEDVVVKAHAHRCAGVCVGCGCACVEWGGLRWVGWEKKMTKGRTGRVVDPLSLPLVAA